MTWEFGAALNAVIGVAYLSICWFILRGLWSTRQLTTNALGTATGLIFFTCGVHHGGHAFSMLGPLVGIDQSGGVALRHAFTWQMDAWDAFGAGVAVFYLSLRRSYGRLLTGPEMFDNAERRHYEERLEEEHASLAEAQKQAKLGSWSIDLSSGDRSWSEEMYRIYGLAPGSDLAEGLDMFVVAEDRERVLDEQAAVLEGSRDLDVTFRIRSPTVGARVLHTRARTERNGEGRPVKLVGTTQDLTDAARVEEARREAEERFRVTFAHAPIGVALVDLTPGAEGRMLSVNGALCGLTGYPESRLLSMALTSIVHPEDAGRLAGDLRLLTTDKTARVELEVRCLHGDGQVVWAVLAGSAVPVEEGVASYAVFHVMDIGDRKRFEGQLQYLADHDALTGLYNRRRFEEELQRTLALAARYGSKGALLMIDLDGFKYVNDTLGHSHGDELVTRIGAILRGELRETDVLARLGGDEFAVILTEVDVVEAEEIAEKVLACLRERAVVLSEHRHASVTASIGVTTFSRESELTGEELLVEADIAMYDAKDAGKNRVGVYRREEERRERLSVRQSSLASLQSAAQDGRLELMAQPIAGICATNVPFYELLLRLRGDNGELIPPGTFLSIAERFDLIQRMDRWVFGEACRLLALHHEAGVDIRLSVNFSGKTMNDPNILADMATLLAARPVPPKRLVVEVTETSAIVNIERARDIARGLRDLGCSFALDDFGAGFASFYYLKHLDFDFLKIDGEFVKNLTQNPTDELVISSLVRIARGLGADTIAEFVGDDATVDKLHLLGVDYGQGYHLGKPAPIREILPALMPA